MYRVEYNFLDRNYSVFLCGHDSAGQMIRQKIFYLNKIQQEWGIINIIF
jgi:hypothetical protein